MIELNRKETLDLGYSASRWLQNVSRKYKNTKGAWKVQTPDGVICSDGLLSVIRCYMNKQVRMLADRRYESFEMRRKDVAKHANISERQAARHIAVLKAHEVIYVDQSASQHRGDFVNFCVVHLVKLMKRIMPQSWLSNVLLERLRYISKLSRKIRQFVHVKKAVRGDIPPRVRGDISRARGRYIYNKPPLLSLRQLYKIRYPKIWTQFNLSKSNTEPIGAAHV